MESKASGANDCCVQPCDETCSEYDDNRWLYRYYQMLIAAKVVQVFFNWLCAAGLEPSTREQIEP